MPRAKPYSPAPATLPTPQLRETKTKMMMVKIDASPQPLTPNSRGLFCHRWLLLTSRGTAPRGRQGQTRPKDKAMPTATYGKRPSTSRSRPVPLPKGAGTQRYLEQFATSIRAPSQTRPPQRGRGLSHDRDLHTQEPVLSPSECSHGCHRDQGPSLPFVVRFFT